jgi:hypothetical protein
MYMAQKVEGHATLTRVSPYTIVWSMLTLMSRTQELNIGISP